jgi:membrane-associated phospholipid phosphatase
VQILIFILGAVGLAIMALAAHGLAYFPGDVAISHAVQAYHPDWLDAATGAVSWIGFPPQSNVLFGVIVILLLVLESRWAAFTEAIAAIGSGGLYWLVALLVERPRPSPDLVRVAGPLQMSGFPSGHLATFTAVLGFVAFIGYRRLSPSRTRWLPIALVVAFLALMSFARIYSGQHWPSDVLAGILLGALWLAVVIRIYCLGEARHRRGVSRQLSAISYQLSAQRDG